MSDTLNIAICSAPVEVTPGEIGYDEKTINKLDGHFQNLILNKKLQCASYILSRHGKIFAWKAMGKLTHHEDSPDMGLDSIRRVASITKPFTAAAIMKLIEDGKLYMQQPVSTIISEFDTDLHKGITIFNLMTHTSGIATDSGYYKEPYNSGWWYKYEAQKSYGDKDLNWIKAVLSGPLDFNPGEKWAYSSAGYMILGEIISRISGVYCEQYIMDNIVKPLGLKDTYFNLPEELHPRVCFTDDWSEKRLKSKKAEDDSEKLPNTAGGLYSTMYDLYKFALMTLNKGTYNGERILSRKSIEYMTTNQLGSNFYAYHWGQNYREYRYGAGFNIKGTELLSRSTYSHEGAGRSLLYIDPDEEVIFSVFVPSQIHWVPEAVIVPRAIIMSGLL